VNHRFQRDRDSHVECASDLNAEEHRRCYANDRERHAFEGESSSDGARRTTKMTLPERMTDNCNGSVCASTAYIVGRSERTTEDRRHSKRREEIAAGEQTINRMRLAALREVETGR